MKPGSGPVPKLELLQSPDWADYELLDSGAGARLERFGPYTFHRPEHQAVWQPALPPSRWEEAHATFEPTGEESGGRWQFHQPVNPSWVMQYKDLRFQSQVTTSRHLGVFPEQAANWDWIEARIRSGGRPVRVLNLFGYTGLATLAAARAGASVTHVDASKKAITWARHNQELSGLGSRPIRWLVDDVYKFVLREARRGSIYEGLILDPPKFGRGPEGQVWEFFESLPNLLQTCRSLLASRPLFIILTAYAIRASALSIHYAVQEMVAGLGGSLTTGELVLTERSAGRLLSMAIFTRWSSD
jgi:23S rRNA (cytosine1962-C5)-methyltransferase